MKNKLVYYLVIFVPLIILGLLKKAELIDSVWFMIYLLSYALVFRTYTDGKRLADKGIIKKTDIWKMIIPGQRIRYFMDLYIR
jgi:hypothetical protein